ncbi:MMPL family transporter [Lysinibacillus sp. KU-BSD001]|uniref:MMPL family transporter n=1 Tax=Lysinibacillus sp. KU-BSD001 TaxID=3141328 RepID=UPI0036EC82E4
MQQLRNKRSLAFLFWLVVVITMLIVMPNLDRLVQEKGQISLPEHVESYLGNELLNDISHEGKSIYSFAFVFHNEEGLTDSNFTEIEEVLTYFMENAETYGITASLLHTESEAIANQLISEDGTTVISQFSIDAKQGTASEVVKKLREPLQDVSIETYVTGADIVNDDFATMTQEGIKKTEVIAVIFIISILVIIFRSPVVPIISLLTVGISYIVSLSLVTLLVEHFNFPFSTFTQVFLVVILFGVGTDYNILLFTRFKEELARTGHVLKAISETYKTAGKTVIYSGIAVLIGFIALYFSQFQMYKATSGVAIGVFVLLLVLLTLNPFFMGLLGFKLFWPVKKVQEHGDNKLWAVLAKLGFLRPLVAILFVGILSIPFILTYSAELNYNDLVEIDNQYESKQAILVIEEHYEAGMSAPTTLVIQHDEVLTTQQNLQALDELAAIIKGTPGVASVYSVTRPEGKRIEDLYIAQQSSTLEEGLTSAQDGVSTIKDGFSEAQTDLEKEQDLSGVQTLIDGTTQLQNGAASLQNALNKLATGTTNAKAGATELASGASSVESGLAEVATGFATLQQNYETIAAGFTQLQPAFIQMEQLINSSKQGYEAILTSMQAYIQTTPEAASNEYIETTIGVAKQAIAELEDLSVQMHGLSAQYEQLISGFAQTNTAFDNAEAGLAQLQHGVATLGTGASSLATGLQQTKDGANQIATQSQAFSSGLNDLQAGQTLLQTSLETLQTQMQQLADGLRKSTNGLGEIYDGLDEANTYLAGLSTNETGTFYIPQEVLKGEDFKASLDAYLLANQTATTFNIVLDVNPYTEEAMDTLREVNKRIDGYVESSALNEADVYLAGKTMSNADLQDIAQQDFIRSAIIMMAGISIILFIITRSFLQTMIIDVSLLLATFASLGLTEILCTQMLGYDMLSWNVPFFTYIMIVSLGVDYSIFLMMRYNETKELGRAEIVNACQQMGGVVLAAAVILGGTFAALIPSGIITLIQVAIAVLIGLVLLTVFIMPLFIPACLGLAEKGTSWMQRRKAKIE